jgi:outer membrane lipoprotein carrier protein
MKFLRKLSILTLLLAPLSITTTWAQPNAVKADPTDAKSKVLLDKVKKQYNGYGSLESIFKVEVKLAEQSKSEVVKGKVYQKGDNFRAEMGSDFVIGNGKVIWQKSGNAVQIKSASGKDADDLITPNTLIRMYEKKEFTFGITGEGAEGWSKKATILTGKPSKRSSEFTKITLVIDQSTSHIVSVTAFGRDQSRSKVTLEPPVLNQKYSDALFTFDKSKYPGIKVQDLRVD